MDNLIQNKYFKYGIIGLIVLLCIVFVFSKFVNSDSVGGLSDSLSPKEIQTQNLDNGETYKSYGVIDTELEGNTFFSLKDGFYTLTVYFADMDFNGDSLKDVNISEMSKGDYVLVTGIYDKNMSALYATEITSIDKDDVTAYKKSQMPILEIEVLNFPSEVKHSCQNVNLVLKLTNTGDVDINYDDIYSSEYNFKLAYLINDTISYTTTTNDNDEIEYVGLKPFGKLEPGDSVEVSLGLGGMVTQTVDPSTSKAVGISGEYNLLYPSGREGGNQGSNEVKLLWVSLYNEEEVLNRENPMILFSTDTFSINLADAECDMDDIQKTVNME